MKKIFLTAGSVIVGLVVGLVLSMIYLIEKHEVDLRKKQTQPARNQRLQNLSEVTQEDVEKANQNNGQGETKESQERKTGTVEG